MKNVSLILGLIVLIGIPLTTAVSADTQPPLQLKVFKASEDHMGLGVNSAIIYGEKEAVLIDAQFTLSNAHRLVAEILETGRRLSTIYITHEHPDHFMGLPVIKQALSRCKGCLNQGKRRRRKRQFRFQIRVLGQAGLGY